MNNMITMKLFQLATENKQTQGALNTAWNLLQSGSYTLCGLVVVFGVVVPVLALLVVRMFRCKINKRQQGAQDQTREGCGSHTLNVMFPIRMIRTVWTALVSFIRSRSFLGWGRGFNRLGLIRGVRFG